jgi:hypothetical protein
LVKLHLTSRLFIEVTQKLIFIAVSLTNMSIGLSSALFQPLLNFALPLYIYIHTYIQTHTYIYARTHTYTHIVISLPFKL